VRRRRRRLLGVDVLGQLDGGFLVLGVGRGERAQVDLEVLGGRLVDAAEVDLEVVVVSHGSAPKHLQ